MQALAQLCFVVEEKPWFQGHLIVKGQSFGIAGVELPKEVPNDCCFGGLPPLPYRVTLIDFKSKREVKTKTNRTGASGDFVKLDGGGISFTTDVLKSDGEAEAHITKFFTKRCAGKDAIVVIGTMTISEDLHNELMGITKPPPPQPTAASTAADGSSTREVIDLCSPELGKQPATQSKSKSPFLVSSDSDETDAESGGGASAKTSQPRQGEGRGPSMECIVLGDSEDSTEQEETSFQHEHEHAHHEEDESGWSHSKRPTSRFGLSRSSGASAKAGQSKPDAEKGLDYTVLSEGRDRLKRLEQEMEKNFPLGKESVPAPISEEVVGSDDEDMWSDS